MIGLGQEDEIEEITVWNGHTQLMFAFSDLGRPRVLSFSERLVKM